MPRYILHVVDENGRNLPDYFVAVLPKSGNATRQYPFWYTRTEASGPMDIQTLSGLDPLAIEVVGPSNPLQPDVYNYITRLTLRSGQDDEFTFRILPIPNQDLATVPKNFVDSNVTRFDAGDPEGSNYGGLPLSAPEWTAYQHALTETLVSLEAETDAQTTIAAGAGALGQTDLGEYKVTITAQRTAGALETDYLCSIAHHGGSLPVTPVVELAGGRQFVLRGASQAVYVHLWRPGQPAHQGIRYRIYPVTGRRERVSVPVPTTRRIELIEAPATVVMSDGRQIRTAYGALAYHGGLHGRMVAHVVTSMQRLAETYAREHSPDATNIAVRAYAGDPDGTSADRGAAYIVLNTSDNLHWTAYRWSRHSQSADTDRLTRDFRIRFLLVEWDE